MCVGLSIFMLLIISMKYNKELVDNLFAKKKKLVDNYIFRLLKLFFVGLHLKRKHIIIVYFMISRRQVWHYFDNYILNTLNFLNLRVDDLTLRF